MAEKQLLIEDCDKKLNGIKCTEDNQSYLNLRCGYCRMSQINLTLAEVGLVEDMLELKAYEAKLGCEKLW